MKHIINIIVLISVFFLPSAGFSQLVYDFSKGEFLPSNNAYNKQTGKVNPIPYGGFIQLNIININTFRYKVELQGNSINYVTPIPSELQTVFKLSAENYDDRNTNNALRLIKQASDQMTQQAKEAEKLSENKAADGSTDEKERLVNNMNELVKACAEYIKIAERVANIKYTRMQLINISKQKWADHSKMMDNMPPTLVESEMKKDYMLFSKYYAEAYVKYENAADAATDVNAEIKKAVVEAKKDITESQNLFYEDNFLKLIEDVTILQHAMENEEYFQVNSAPIQIDGDYADFKVKITPAQVNDLMPYEISRTFPVEVPVKGGLKVDFSTGPAISFGKNSRDDIYFAEVSKTDPNISVLKKRGNNNSISPGIAAMMHFGPRSGKDFRPTLMFGLGAGFQNTSDVNLSLYFGGSLVFGKRERVMLSSGVSYLKVTRLKTEQYVVDQQYTTPINIADITEKIFKPSFFLSLSYNLTNRLEIK